MKTFLSILFFPFLLIYSQDDQPSNPNVELPDFVITGQDVVSIKRTDKIKPDLVSTITEGFIQPYHPPEELGLRQLSNPIKKELNILDSTKFYNGSFKAGGGIYLLPEADLSYHVPFNNGLLNLGTGGFNQSAYVDNADRYSFNGRAGIEYTISMDDNGLSGTNFLLNGNYTTSNYKLFGSNKPETKRTKNVGNYSIGIKNVSGRTFIIDINLKDYFTSSTEDNFTENLISAIGFARLQLADIGIGLKTNYQSQILNTDSLSSVSNNYLFLRPTVSFELFGSVKTEVGYSFNNQNGKTFNDIYAAFGLKLSDNLILMGEYAPQAEFITSGRFFRRNDYFNPYSFDKLMVRKANYIGAAVKYEYERYYQIDAGFKDYKAGNLPYYANSDLSGQFDIATADAKEFNGFLNVLFHLGPYGVFYFDADYYDITNGDGKRLPYYPKFIGNFTYGYELNKKLLGEILVNYYSDRYTNIENTNKLSSFFNLGAKLTYKIEDSFLVYLEATNLLNRDIYYWNNYIEKQFDLLAGIKLLFD